MTRFFALVTVLATPLLAHAQTVRDGDTSPKGAVARLGTTRFRHGTDVTFLAYHPDGKSVFSAGTAWDPSIRQWDLNGREMRRFVLRPVDMSINGFTERTALIHYCTMAALSLDGKRLAGWYQEPMIHVWDVETGKELASPTIGGSPWPPAGLTWSRDGNKLAVSETHGHIVLWDIAKGKKIRDIEGEQGGDIGQGTMRVLFSENDRLVIGQATKLGPNKMYQSVVKAWAVETGKVIYELPGRLDFCIAQSPDGTLMTYASLEEKQIVVAEIETGKTRQIVTMDVGQQEPTYCAFSKDNAQLFVQVFFENEIRVFDVATGKQKRTIGPKGQWSRFSRSSRNYLVLSPDGKMVARTGDGQGPRFFDVASGKEVMGGFGRFAVRHVTFVAEGKILLVQDESNVLRWWNVAGGRIAKTFAADGNEHWPCIGTDAAGSILVAPQTIYESGEVKFDVTDLFSGKRLAHIDALTVISGSFAFAADGRTAAVYHEIEESRELYLHDLPSLAKRGTVPIVVQKNDGNAAGAIVLSGDGRQVAVYSGPRTMSIFDCKTGRILARIELPFNSYRLFSGTFSPDQRMLAFDLENGQVEIWESRTGKSRVTFGEKYDLQTGRVPLPQPAYWAPDPYATNLHSAAATIAFSPDSKLLAHGRLDGSVEIWDLSAGKIAATLKGHDMRVNTVAFSPDGAFLASGSSDTTVVVWEAPRARK